MRKFDHIHSFLSRAQGNNGRAPHQGFIPLTWGSWPQGEAASQNQQDQPASFIWWTLLGGHGSAGCLGGCEFPLGLRTPWAACRVQEPGCSVHFILFSRSGAYEDDTWLAWRIFISLVSTCFFWVVNIT